MITLELLTDFLHEHLRYNKDIICDSFTIHSMIQDVIEEIKKVNIMVVKYFVTITLEEWREQQLMKIIQ